MKINVVGIWRTFEARNQIFLKVLPMKGIGRFDNRGKLSPRFVGLFDIIERIGLVAYIVALPSDLVRIQNVFYVSIFIEILARSYSYYSL